MKWWHWLVLELLIIFGVIAWIYFFPSEIEYDFAKGLIGFALIYAIEECKDVFNPLHKYKPMQKREKIDNGQLELFEEEM